LHVLLHCSSMKAEVVQTRRKVRSIRSKEFEIKVGIVIVRKVGISSVIRYEELN